MADSNQKIYNLISDYSISIPDNVAIEDNENSITYSELETISNSIAAELLNMNIPIGSFVLLHFIPSLEFIVTLLGVWKAGLAYIPVSINTPSKKIRQIIKESKSELIITNSSDFESEDAKVLNYESLSKTETINKVREYELAYVLFTSGSTGKPKGAKISHNNLLYYSNWSSNYFSSTVDNKLPLTSDINFAASVSQIFSCLLAGKTLVVATNLIGNPPELFQFYSTNEDYGLYCVPSVWKMLMDWFCKSSRNIYRNSPKVLFLSGEDIPKKLLDETRNLFPNMQIWNLYGPTESVANVSYKNLTNEESVSIGTPIPNTTFFVIKEDGNEASFNEVGQLYVSGDGISDGYLNNNKLTQELFFDYSTKSGDIFKVYNTGDYVKRISKNDLKYVGRVDHQIKINGQRIELGEIESLLNNNSEVNQAVVQYKKSIIVFVKLNHGSQVQKKDLINYLIEYLPLASLPEEWVFVEDFEYLDNGKIDRLKLTYNNKKELIRLFDSNKSDNENKLLDIFRKVLRNPNITSDDNFFHCGGNSLSVITLLTEIEENFNIYVKISDFFLNPTPNYLIEKITQSNEVKKPRKNIEYFNELTELRLSSSQKSIYLYLQAHPDSSSYNIAYSIQLEGFNNELKLLESIKEITTQSTLLSSKVVYKDDDIWFQKNEHEIEIEYENLRDISDDEKDYFIKNSISDLASTPISLDEVLYRYKLFKINDNKYVLGFVVNHIAFDGESLPIYIKQLVNSYTNDKHKDNTICNYPIVSLKRENYEKTNLYNISLSYWTEYLNGISNFGGLPSIYNFSSKNEGGRFSNKTDIFFRDRLNTIAVSKGLTINMLLLTAFVIAIYKFEKREEFLIALPFSNRMDSLEQGTIGYLSNTLLLRCRLDNSTEFDTLANQIKTDIIAMLDHQQISIQQLLNLLSENGVVIPNSGFNLLFTYHNSDRYSIESNNINVIAKEESNKSSKCELQFECFDDGKSIEFVLTFHTSKMNNSFALHFTNVFKQILKSVGEEEKSKVSDLPKLWDTEKEFIINNSYGKEIDYSSELTLYNLYLKSAKKHRNNIALNYYDDNITYGELTYKVNSLVHYLVSREIDNSKAVAIYLDHSPELIISILALASLGIPYIPLDPNYPLERNKQIIESSEASFILTSTHYYSSTPKGKFESIVIDECEKQNSSETLRSQTKPNDLLYIIFTSGSTGKPKGVSIPNRGVSNYLLWMKNNFRIDNEAIILAKTSISFDISIWELFLPLISGGQLIIRNRKDLESPEQIADIINHCNVNITQFVPSGLKLFYDANMFDNSESLRMIFCGGEELPKTLETKVLNRFKGNLVNLYGPTEASIFMSSHLCSKSSDTANVSIGKPITNSGLLVLDDEMNLVPRGFAGKLFITGSVLANGYYNDISKTKEVFIESKLAFRTNKIYYTGDYGRMLLNGSFEYLGRQDKQIKIRGYRVELGEIENKIRSVIGLEEVVVFNNKKSEDDIRISAAIVAKDIIDLVKLKSDLALYMPQYMIPSSLYQVDKIPMLPSGKVDYNALRRENFKKILKKPKFDYVKKDDLEETIFKIWSEVIGHSNFSISDNFFDAGGHSVLFLKIKDKIKEKLGVDFSLIDMYQHPNIRLIAEEYRRKYKNSDAQPAQMIRDRIKLKKQSYRKNGRNKK